MLTSSVQAVELFNENGSRIDGFEEYSKAECKILLQISQLTKLKWNFVLVRQGYLSLLHYFIEILKWYGSGLRLIGDNHWYTIQKIKLNCYGMRQYS